MDGLILPKSPKPEEPLLSISSKRRLSPPPELAPTLDLTSDSSILSTLRSSPPHETVVQILQHLSASSSIKTASPASTQIIRCLLDTTIPTFADALDKRQKTQLAKCVASPVGLSAIVGRIKTLLSLVRGKAASAVSVERKDLEDVLELLQSTLGRRKFVRDMWRLVNDGTEVKRGLLWREFVGLVGGGKLLGIAAEAEVALGRNLEDAEMKGRWVGDGKTYAVWLGKELAEAAGAEKVDDDTFKAVTALLGGSFRLGYTENIVENLTFTLIYPADQSSNLVKVLSILPDHDKRTYLTSLLRILSTQKLNTIYTPSDPDWWKHDSALISGAASLLQVITSQDETFREFLLEWLTSSSGGAVGESIGIRRAIIPIIAQDRLTFIQLFEKSLQQFSDKLWIKHTPVLRQEVNVQILLLCAGWSSRHDPSVLKRFTKSTHFLNGVSNRLGALSSLRARFLGMVLAEAFSQLDAGGQKLSFDVDETLSEEALWWKSIPTVCDTIGTFTNLFPAAITTLSLRTRPPTSNPPAPDSSLQPTTTTPDSDSDSDSDSFTPYALPANAPPVDSDPDEPPDRSAPSPPVYLHQLQTYLANITSYPHFTLALQHAAPLIRRRTNTRDLTSHLLPLLTAFINLHDPFDTPTFTAQRRAAMVALTVAGPAPAGQFLTRQFFAPELGLSQRLEILTVIALACRELGGLAAPPPLQKQVLPNKHYAADTKQLADAVHTEIAISHLPKVVSERRFFGSKITSKGNPLHAVAGPAFFYPLTAGLWRAQEARWGLGDKVLLSALIDTLAVVLWCCGPAAPGGREMWMEFLGVCKGVRGRCVEAVLGGLVVVLEVMVEAAGKGGVVEMLGVGVEEWRGWVEEVFEGPDGGEIRSRAARALVVLGECVEEWRSVVLGGVVDV